MKQLWVMRHARAEENIQLKDFDRSLIQQGIEDAKRMAELLKKLKVTPDIILYSAAKRTTQTQEIVRKVCGWDDIKAKSESILYQANASTIYEILNDYFFSFNRIFLVGHNPSLTELAGIISTSTIQFLPPSGWYQVNWNTETKGVLTEFQFPAVHC